MSSEPVIRVVRSGLEESVHQADVVAVDPDGEIVASVGDPDRMLYARSSMKPLQATVSLSLAPFEYSNREIAVMCASHNAEPVHVEAVRGIFGRAGLDESLLQCPARRPWDEETAAVDPEVRRINSDCSGKHAGMLAACAARGWPVETYLDPDHPYQQAVLQAVLRATQLGSVGVGVDGCGVPVHSMPLRRLAAIYAGMARPDHWGELAPHAARALSAMKAEPYMVAGRNRVDTAVMEVTGNVAVKAGAEGLLCASVLDRAIGLAVKVRDGSSRAAAPVLIRALRLLDAIDEDLVKQLEPFARPAVLGGGRPVGELETAFDLSP